MGKANSRKIETKNSNNYVSVEVSVQFNQIVVIDGIRLKLFFSLLEIANFQLKNEKCTDKKTILLKNNFLHRNVVGFIATVY